MGAVITRDLSPSPLSPADGASTNEDQLSSEDVCVSTNGLSQDAWCTSGPTYSAVAPPSDSVHQNQALEPWQPAKGRGRAHVCKQHTGSARYYPYQGSRIRRIRHVRRVRQKVVNMPVRKRTAGMVGSSWSLPARRGLQRG
ncbi:hypothetical protein N7530_010564 [Penicillium desertorum]|uniref:Uncharacterized protein n=1 Tax=Penicillium desertorum TaxID=1303715 RepID=A0A9W9WHN4_9EURO|nr:hypothetical protein N7530_010564 [Penicillium desertorum]